ncbi:MAG: dihydroorotase [Chitinophagaceae bacterium]|nr:dihydroorotase [Chitinophagaceae bacterium]
MNLLIKQAVIIDPRSPFHGKPVDIFIENGIIKKIDAEIRSTADEEVFYEGLHVSPGWVDVFSHFNDPGFENKETLESGAAAAAAGGFTDVFVLPNTKPAIDDKAGVEYILKKSSSFATALHPLGAVTKNIAGKELAEMYDMKASGAVAFSDGIQPVQSSGLMLKALQYIRAFDGILMQVPDDRSLQPQGLMHEGIVSTRMGLPGKPALSEELMIYRDVKLTGYAESKLHISGVTLGKSVQIIEEARANGCDITCSVTPFHLFFCDEDLAGYDTCLKVFPPLRNREEREALKKAVAEGQVDCFASHHLPQDYDSKTMEFEHAEPGMIGLQTVFSAIRTAMPGLALDKIVQMLSLNPRKIFGLSEALIAEDQPAILTLFLPFERWQLRREDIRSLSANSPFIGKELTGKPAGIIHHQRYVLL